jgi:predicted nucleotidyltransferase
MKHFSSYFIFRPLAPSDMARDWHLPSFFTYFRKNVEESLELSKLMLIFANETITRQAMSTETMTQKIAEYFKTQPVLKAWIFGSYSRGEQRPDSDIDILVVLDYSQPVGLKFFGMYEDLKELLGCPVDLVVDRSLAPYARESIERDKILIYERAA